MSEDATQDQDQQQDQQQDGAGDELPESEVEQIEAERQERLDPENRPHNAEVDNTQRDFDEEEGAFLDDGDESDLTDEERAATGA